ncbi:MAG TPA: TonB-dependent receptor [Gemmatimonadaceae bacterium]|nr:TonB-dependent receptor [Gemmatimonadaceae bacterium]
MNRSPRRPNFGELAALSVVCALGVTISRDARAQQGTPPKATLPPVEVTVTRDAARSTLELPFAVSRVVPDSGRPALRHVSFDEMLLALPGVTVANRSNPTQDPRISIRGFGARSAFGVRGVRVVRDGIPLTLPDGQTPIDYLDLESVGRIEVIRGSAGSLYGNAAGGVVDVRTADPPTDVVAGRVTGYGGSYGLKRWASSAGGTSGIVRYQGSVSRTEQDGFRRYAAQKSTGGTARAMVNGSLGELSLTYTGYDTPTAQNPGALTRAEMRTDPRQADPAQVRKGARKAVTQSQLGLVATRRTTHGLELSATAHFGWRTLDNPLTFAVVDVDRTTSGAGARITAPAKLLGLEHRLSAGVDAQFQDDDRLNFANCNFQPPLAAPTASCPKLGTERGVRQLDQRERVSGIGPFVRDEIAFANRYRVTLGARADVVKFRVDDRLIAGTNPDDSGERTLHAVSPLVGFVARLGTLHAAYANVSTAFETPTATELANKPDGSAGINPSLDPQYATTAEVGMKGAVFGRVRYDASLFATRVKDELIPFEVPGGGGRRYFRNAGSTRRRGAELGLAAALGMTTVGVSYSYSDFIFTDYKVGANDFSDSRIPGVPNQQLQGYATWGWRGWFATLEGQTAGGMFMDDANTLRSSSWEVANARIGGRIEVGSLTLAPVFAVSNLFDRAYAGSIVINAAAGRYFEPAPGRTVYAGMSLGVGR